MLITECIKDISINWVLYDLDDTAVDVVVCTLTPNIIEMIIVMNLMSKYTLWMKFSLKVRKIAIRNDGIAHSSKKIRIKRQILKMK